jgi:hypothetical protein
MLSFVSFFNFSHENGYELVPGFGCNLHLEEWWLMMLSDISHEGGVGFYTNSFIIDKNQLEGF